MQRSILYVDGFNFYYGVTKYWREKNKEWAGLGWCDFRALVERHYPPKDFQLDVKYFTAPVYQQHQTPHHRPGEPSRYANWARAVRTIRGVRVIEGFYKMDRDRPVSGDVLNPDAPAKSRDEKQSDINLAVEVMLDALGPAPPNQAFLLSADSDLMPVVFALLERLEVPIPVVVLLPSEAEETKKWRENYRETAERLVSCGVVKRGPYVREPTVHLLTKEVLATSLLRYKLADHEGEFECLKEWQLKPAFLDRHCHNREWRPDLLPVARR